MRNDPLAFLILDPIITVHPDQVIFEVFSKDEGTYAKLGLPRSAFALDSEPACGTTNIDFSAALYAGIQQMRSYRETRVGVGREQVKVATAAATRGEVLEKKIRVPDTWVRGFLQVQSSATLPRGTRIRIGERLPLEQILFGPAHTTHGTQNLVGALRQSMGALGAATIREMHRVEMVVAPTIATEGKSWQRADR